MEWEESHKAACKLEHGLTGNVIENLEKTLGHPNTCPHGNPVPSESGAIMEEESEPFTGLNPHEAGVIVKITQEEPDSLRYLATLGLKPGTSIEVLEKPFKGSMTIRKGSEVHALERNIASTIWIRRILDVTEE